MAKVYQHSKLKYLPWFVRPKYMMDQNKILSTSKDPNYDPSSLHIPVEEFQYFTPTMVQYWTYKKDNFDKILFFKLGRFYEMFYDDAIALNIMLDLNWMGGKYKVHVGFPENMLYKVSANLVNKGFTVAVVDQTETNLMALERINTDKNKNEKENLKNKFQ